MIETFLNVYTCRNTNSNVFKEQKIFEDYLKENRYTVFRYTQNSMSPHFMKWCGSYQSTLSNNSVSHYFDTESEAIEWCANYWGCKNIKIYDPALFESFEKFKLEHIFDSIGSDIIVRSIDNSHCYTIKKSITLDYKIRYLVRYDGKYRIVRNSAESSSQAVEWCVQHWMNKISKKG